jgi:hypothetical protein
MFVMAGNIRQRISFPATHCAAAGLTVRVIVKLRPDEYDERFRHVRRIGSTMSAFLRESAARAIKEGQPVALGRALLPEIPIAPDQTSQPCADIPTQPTG